MATAIFIAVPGFSAPAPSAIAPPTPSRLSIPSAAAQARAEKLVRDVFGSYMSEPPIKRDDIAGKMLEQAATTKDDSDARFVLLKDAADLAAGTGDASLAMQAATLMAQSYAVDGGDLKVDLLKKSAFTATTPGALEAVVDEGLNSANDAAAGGDFDLAMRLITPTESAARNSRDVPLVQAVGSRAAELRWMQQESVRAKSAEQRLASNPNDPDANLTVGRFLCLVKGDWRVGLPRLVKSASPGFRAAAVADLSVPTHYEKQVSAGDLWWDLAEKDLNGPQVFLRQRAAYWYSRALTDAEFAGLNRARVEKRVAAVPQSGSAVGDASGVAPTTRPKTTPGAATKPAKPGPVAKPGPAVKPVPGANPVPPANPAPPETAVTPPAATPTPAPATPPSATPAPPEDPPQAPGESIFSDKPTKPAPKP